MMTNLPIRGMLVGLLAGVLAFDFARIFGEPQVDRAIALEEQMRHARGEAPEPELVGRQTRAGLGLFTTLQSMAPLWAACFRWRSPLYMAVR